MAPDSTLEKLNARLAALLRELDAGTIALVNAFAQYLSDGCPSASDMAIRRASRKALHNSFERGSLSALERDIRTLATDSFAIAWRAAADDTGRCETGADASASGAEGAFTRPLGILQKQLRRSRRVEDDQRRDEGDWAGRACAARLSYDELDTRWREYQDLLRQTGECLQDIDAHLRDRMVWQAFGPSI